MKKTLQQGFTLIELLVVVAIIGILASLVIASVNQARTRGVDAAIKATMSSMRAQAELFYDGLGGYSGLCDDPNFERLLNDVADKNGAGEINGSGGSTVSCAAEQLAWVVDATLTTGGTFCVDATGFAGEGGVAQGSLECQPSVQPSNSD